MGRKKRRGLAIPTPCNNCREGWLQQVPQHADLKPIGPHELPTRPSVLAVALFCLFTTDCTEDVKHKQEKKEELSMHGNEFARMLETALSLKLMKHSPLLGNPCRVCHGFVSPVSYQNLCFPTVKTSLGS